MVYRESGAQRVALAERLRRLPLPFFGRRDLADLTETVMTDVTTVEHVMSHVPPELWGAYISTAVVAVALLILDWRLAAASLWTVPVAFAVLFCSRRLLRPAQERARAEAVAVSVGIQEALECVREIRATNHEDEYVARLGAQMDEWERRQSLSEAAGAVPMGVAQALMRLGMATTVVAAAALVAAGDIGFLEAFVFMLVIARIYAPFDQALMMVFELFASRVAAGRMASFQEEPVAEGSTDFRPEGHDVELDSVTFSYGPDTPDVLRDVSFTAREGEVTALVGPSGGGKSTCTRLAARFWDPQGGTVRVGGVDVAGVDPETLLGDFSVVFQDVLLFDDTVMENIRLGRSDATDDEVLAAAAAANCDGFVGRLTEGYATRIGENGSRLSGGERQRISIARALLKDAPVVLLDEATASLDVESAEVQAALSHLLAGRTVLVITHRMWTVRGADKVVVLSGGRVVEQGTPDGLLTADGVFARMVRLQEEAGAWRLWCRARLRGAAQVAAGA